MKRLILLGLIFSLILAGTLACSPDKESQEKKEIEEKIEEIVEEEENEEPEEEEEVEDSGWEEAYADFIEKAPYNNYSYEDMPIVEPVFFYGLLDMDEDSVPELILAVMSGVQSPDAYPLDNLYIQVHTYSKEKGIEAKEAFSVYRPRLLKDENNNLIVSTINTFGNATAYYGSVKLVDGNLYHEEIYDGVFPDFEYSKTFDEEHGFESFELIEITRASLDEEESEDIHIGSLDQVNLIGEYENKQGEVNSIYADEDGRLLISHRDNEYEIDLDNISHDGSIEAFRVRNSIGDTVICMYIYPPGLELSVINHSANSIDETDLDRLRLFFTYQDAPDINYNVYYMVD